MGKPVVTKANTLFFEDKPLFGLDIGHGKIRVMELRPGKGLPKLMGYGEATFDPEAVKDGVIEKPETIAETVQELFKHHLVGDITTDRVAMSLPIARAFTRSIDVLYIDYTRVRTQGEKTSVFIVAMPKRIVDSYITLARLLGLEAICMQTSSGAGAHLFSRDSQSDIPTLLIDFGSDSADITVYDGGPVVSGTVACGSELFTTAIAKELNVTLKEAMLIKAKYGLGMSKKQAQIEKALNPSLSLLIKEIKRTTRYYEERAYGGEKISQVVIAGGGANMPGLAEYLTSNLRLAVRSFDPTSYIDFGRLQPFNITERMSYVTAAGLASIDPVEALV
jgi:type IV pilus assembly protein PilM